MSAANLANIVRAVDGTASVIPMPVQGIVLVRLADRSAAVPTARAYQLLHLSGLAGITAQPGTKDWKWQVATTAGALLGDWQG